MQQREFGAVTLGGVHGKVDRISPRFAVMDITAEC